MIRFLGWHTLTVIDQILESPLSSISRNSAVSLCRMDAATRPAHVPALSVDMGLLPWLPPPSLLPR